MWRVPVWERFEQGSFFILKKKKEFKLIFCVKSLNNINFACMHCCGMLLGGCEQLAEGVRALLPLCGLHSKCLYPLSHLTSPRGFLLLALDGYCFSFHFQEERPCETKGIPKVAQRLDFNSYITSLHPTILYCHQNSVPHPTQSIAGETRETFKGMHTPNRKNKCQ